MCNSIGTIVSHLKTANRVEWRTVAVFTLGRFEQPIAQVDRETRVDEHWRALELAPHARHFSSNGL
jgi:hypothetical protein